MKVRFIEELVESPRLREIAAIAVGIGIVAGEALSEDSNASLATRAAFIGSFAAAGFGAAELVNNLLPSTNGHQPDLRILNSRQ